MSATRFGYLKWMIPLDLAYPAALLFVTGCGYFTAYLPGWLAAFLDAHNIRTLETMLWWMTGGQFVKAAFCLAAMLRRSLTSADRL